MIPVISKNTKETKRMERGTKLGIVGNFNRTAPKDFLAKNQEIEILRRNSSYTIWEVYSRPRIHKCKDPAVEMGTGSLTTE